MNINVSKYGFVGMCADGEDIVFDGNQFTYGQGGPPNIYMQQLLAFLNDSGIQKWLYFCIQSCVVKKDGKEGHFHVYFEATDKNVADIVLHQHLPGYDCDLVFTQNGMSQWICDKGLRLIGSTGNLPF